MNQTPEWTAAQRREWLAQEAASKAEAPSSDQEVRIYQAVLRAARQAPRTAPPADFAAAAARQAQKRDLDDALERWMLRIGALLALVGVLFYSGPAVLGGLHLSAEALQTLSGAGQSWLSSPWLATVALALAAAAVLDRVKEVRGA